MTGAVERLIPDAWSACVLVGGTLLTWGFVSLARRVERFDKTLSSKLDRNAAELRDVEEHVQRSVNRLSADVRSWSREISAHIVTTNTRVDASNAEIDHVAATKAA